MPVRRWLFRVRHVLEAIDRILAFTEGMDGETFSRDVKTINAVLHNFTVIGEAVRSIPAEKQLSHSEIPWSEMVAMRNVMVHEYDQVDVDVVWQTIQEDLPPLIPLLKNIISEENDV